MTKKQKNQYLETDMLRQLLSPLKGKKFRLDCGHYVTLNHFLGNDVVIYNGKKLKIICTLCAY